ncbi:hypothetical protein [Thalassotalea marina]|uniref:hypothetical protein n=1 Tax=Thalassotalea marina TaxID=1673741 RepID=UPI00167B3936|nr:hypothetical protein [Thalassotalea marina]
MKNLLILIVVAALFLHFFPQPKLTQWYHEQKETVLEMFNTATDTKVRLNPNKIYRNLSKDLSSFNEQEQEYLKEITETRSNVKSFYFEYCDKPKRTPRLHQKNQETVCNVIKPYQSLF